MYYFMLVSQFWEYFSKSVMKTVKDVLVAVLRKAPNFSKGSLKYIWIVIL